MVRGLYTAATGMMVQRHKMDTLTNNLVNTETTGFKKDTVVTSSFDRVMLQRINDPDVTVYGARVGAYSYGTHIDERVTDYLQGVLEETGRSTDLALEGEGFFAVETEEGERYTRDGSFTVNRGGYLTTQDGNYVLGDNGRIYVGSPDFSVASDGTVTAPQGTGDRLRLVSFAAPEQLRKQGNNLYYPYDGEAPVQAQNTAVRQRSLEGSNVDAADEMVNMLTVYRKYEASQKIVDMTDDTLGMAVNIGKVGG